MHASEFLNSRKLAYFSWATAVAAGLDLTILMLVLIAVPLGRPGLALIGNRCLCTLCSGVAWCLLAAEATSLAAKIYPELQHLASRGDGALTITRLSANLRFLYWITILMRVAGIALTVALGTLLLAGQLEKNITIGAVYVFTIAPLDFVFLGSYLAVGYLELREEAILLTRLEGARFPSTESVMSTDPEAPSTESSECEDSDFE